MSHSSPSPSLRRPVVLLLIACATALGLGGCAASIDGGAVPPTGAPTEQIRDVSHELGSTEIVGEPSRVVALEYSFVQALDSLGALPIGIADDDDSERITQLLGREIDYTSVGTRLEPNLELVASLQPDLIVADLTRHGTIVGQLQEIAPTIVLNSWEGSYDTIKESEITIADALGDREAGERAVSEHEARMAELAAQLPEGDGRRYLFAVANPEDMSLQTSTSFTGSVFQELGLAPAITGGAPVESGVSLERLVDVDPDVLFIATQGTASAYDIWPQNASWASIAAVRAGAVHEVDRNEFSRFRGLQTAERIAEEVVRSAAAG